MSKELTDAKRKAIKKYAENHMKQINLKLNVKTDADILEWLQEKDNVQGYIKQLIHEDMTQNT